MKIFSTSGRFNVAGKPYEFKSYQLSPNGSRAIVRFTGPDKLERETEFRVEGSPQQISHERLTLTLRYALFRRILNPGANGIARNPYLD